MSPVATLLSALALSLLPDPSEGIDTFTIYERRRMDDISDAIYDNLPGESEEEEGGKGGEVPNQCL